MPQRLQVAVVADSTISLPPQLLQGLPLHVVPLELVFQGRVMRDGVDLSPEEFYALLPRVEIPPKTSAPRPASFLQAFQEASTYARGVLCMTMSSQVSATYESARTAAEMARESLPHLPIHVMDTRTAGGAEGLVALEAARAAAAGAELEVVVRVAQRVVERVHFLGVLETLYYIWKGGRIPKVALWATSFLNIKPILDFWQGEVRLVERPRTKQRAVERLIAVMRSRVEGRPLHVNVMHAASPQEAEALKARIQETFTCAEVFTSIFTPVIGAHTGPGLLGIAFYEEPPPEG